MVPNIQIQTNSFIANVQDIKKIIKLHLKASDITLKSIDSLEIYILPEDGSLYYVATTTDHRIFKNEQPLFVWK